MSSGNLFILGWKVKVTSHDKSVGLQTECNIAAVCLRKPCWFSPAAMLRVFPCIASPLPMLLITSFFHGVFLQSGSCNDIDSVEWVMAPLWVLTSSGCICIISVTFRQPSDHAVDHECNHMTVCNYVTRCVYCMFRCIRGGYNKPPLF